MPHLLRFQATLASLGILAGMMTVSSPVFAAPSRGDIQITTSAWDDTHPSNDPVTTNANFPGLALTAMNGAFNGQRATICNTLKARLTAANGIGPGYSAHPDTSGSNAFICTLGTAPTSLDIRLQSGAYIIAYTIRGNLLELTTTQPTVLGSSVDPRFSVVFDATLTVTIPIPSHTGPLTAQSAIGSISNSHLDSHNLAADLIQSLSSVINFFGGPNYQTMAQNALNSSSVNLTSQATAILAQLNLAQFAGQGFTQITGSLTSTNGFALLLVKPVVVPTRGSGSLRVTVEWQHGSGAPTGGCVAFTARATVQVGPASAGSPTAAAGNPKTSGSGAPAQGPAWQTCVLTITGLPQGLPLTVSAALNNAWNTTSYSVIGLAPYGEGPNVVTLRSTPGSIVFLLGVRSTAPLHSVATPAPAPFPTRRP